MSISSKHFVGGWRFTRRAVLATVTAMSMTACGPDDGEYGDQGASTGKGGHPMSGLGAAVSGTNEPGSDAQSATSLKNLYRGVLGNLDLDDFRDPVVEAGSLTGDFEYSVVDINADDKPELLVSARGSEFHSIRVYGASEDNTNLVAPAKILHAGASSSGGRRMAIEATSDHSGLLGTDLQAGSGQSRSVIWRFEGSELQESDRVWTYRFDQVPPELDALVVPLKWISTDDSSALDTLTVGGSVGDGASTGDGPQPTPGGGAGGSAGDGGSGAGGPVDTSAQGTLPASATAPGSQIGGTCGTVDGATVTAGDNTTCGFAMNVAQQALQPVYANDGSGYAGVASVSASSPSTGTVYTMSCTIGSSGGISTCSGGNDAMVRMEKSGNGSLLYLVN